MKKFSHIYIEKAALDFPLTKKILDKFSASEIIEINSYTEIFNRNRQDFALQKASQKMILAIKKDEFLYSGSPYTPDFGYKHFYYNAMVLNCLYNCSYCYLQGMFNSGNLLIYLNGQDFIDAAVTKLQEVKSLYLCISYDTDLLAIENITNYCNDWIQACKENPGLIVECRTKSANYNAIAANQPVSNFILAWTISPEEITNQFEAKTPSLKARLSAIKKAISDGWQVRLCIDPVLLIDNWQRIYQNFIKQIFAEIDPASIQDLSIGSFRMNQEYFKKIKKFRNQEWIYNFPYQTEQEVLTYTEKQKDSIKTEIDAYLEAAGVEKEKRFYFF